MRFFILNRLLATLVLPLLCISKIIAETKEPLLEQCVPADDDININKFDKDYSKQCYLLSNFPKNSKIYIRTKRFVSPNVEKMGPFTVNEKGSLLYVISARGYLPGERVLFQFVNKKGKVILQKSLFPNPLVATSEEATFTVEAELKGISYSLRIPNAKSGEKFEIASLTHCKLNTIQCIYANEINVFPGLKGFDGGITKITLIRKENGDKATLDLMWGNELVKYFMNAQLTAHPEWADKLKSI